MLLQATTLKKVYQASKLSLIFGMQSTKKEGFKIVLLKVRYLFQKKQVNLPGDI